MGINITPAEFREKHARRLKGSVEDIRRGVNAVTESPMEKAAAAQDKMLMRLTERINDGTWAARLKSVSLGDWKKAMLDKGVGRIAAGIDGASAKVEKFAGELLSYESSLQSRVEGMPDVTLEDSISRMTTWVRGMAEFRRS